MRLTIDEGGQGRGEKEPDRSVGSKQFEKEPVYTGSILKSPRIMALSVSDLRASDIDFVNS